MTEIYNRKGDLIFQDESLSLRELAEKNKSNLKYANLKYANLSEANLSYASLWDANLNEANLRGADLSEANLRFASLWDANLRDANLEGAGFDCITIFPNGKSLRELLLNELLNKGE